MFGASKDRAECVRGVSGFSLTDIYLAVVSRWAQQEHWRPASLPKVEHLTEAVAARPAITPVWARHFGPI